MYLYDTSYVYMYMGGVNAIAPNTVEPLTVDTSEIRTHYIVDTTLGHNYSKYV